LLFLLIKPYLILLLCSPAGVTVHYSLLFEMSSPAGAGKEEEEEEAGPVAGETVSMGDAPGLRDMVAEALRQDASLPIDMDSLRFTPAGRGPRGVDGW